MSNPFASFSSYQEDPTFATLYLSDVCKYPALSNKHGVRHEKLTVNDVDDIFNLLWSLSDRQEPTNDFKVWFQMMFLLHPISDPHIMFTLLEMNKHDDYASKESENDPTGPYKVPLLLYWLRNTLELSQLEHELMDPIVDNVANSGNLVVSGLDVLHYTGHGTFTYKDMLEVMKIDYATGEWKTTFFQEQQTIFQLYCEDILRIQDVSGLRDTLLKLSKVKYDWYVYNTLYLGIIIDQTQVHQIIKQIV